MAGPTGVTIRTYQVGFGDCFLLTFRYAGATVRNVLIDFGTTGLPARLGISAAAHMTKIAKQIAKDCGADEGSGKQGKLHAVVATHRHRDHISGFATSGKDGGSGGIIARLRPDVIVQPWTEHPKAALGALTAPGDGKGFLRFRAGLDAMHAVAQAVVGFARRELDRPDGSGVSRALLERLAFIGEDNVKNLSAVKNLIAMGSRKGAKGVYTSYRKPSGLERVLPGVEVTVLGPPTLRDTSGIHKQRSRDPDEFWHLLAGARRFAGGRALLKGIGLSPTLGRKDARGVAGPPLPPQARWFADRLEALRGSQLLQIVTALDTALNNTSLILLFEFGGRRLLFPGDAQLENWSYALRDVKDAAKNVDLVAGVDVYKVGHHGSLNATPKTLLWQHLKKRKKPGAARLRTLLSTMPGKHGSTKSRTEVPRRPLLDALEAETVLVNTQAFKLGTTQPTLSQAIELEAR